MPFIFGGKKLPFWVRKKPTHVATIFGRQISAAKLVEYKSVPCNFQSFKF